MSYRRRILECKHGQVRLTLPSTYSMTMHKCLRVSKEQNIETTNGFSAKVRMSRSTNTCWIWFLRIRFCRLIFFIANRWRVSLWRTRNTALHGQEKRGRSVNDGTEVKMTGTGQFVVYWRVLKGNHPRDSERNNCCDQTSVDRWGEVEAQKYYNMPSFQFLFCFCWALCGNNTIYKEVSLTHP